METVYQKIEILQVKEYNSQSSLTCMFYVSGKELDQPRKNGYVIKYKYKEGGGGAKFFLHKKDVLLEMKRRILENK